LDINQGELMKPFDHINFLEAIDGQEISDELKKKNKTEGYKKRKDK
jgi:hypothetical protein